MSTNTLNNFPESKLGSDFSKENLKNFKPLIDAGVSFVVHSMPGVGTSYFLKYLSTTNLAYFIHIDIYSLPELTQEEFYKLVPTKQDLKKLSEKHEKIVIIFSRFDQLKKEFDQKFLSNLQSLAEVAPNKIVLIFTAIKPLYELAPEALTGGNLNFYSQDLYFKPYSKGDLKKLLSIIPHPPVEAKILDNLIELSGGHFQLLNIFLSSHKQQNLLLDQFVKMQMKGLVDYLDYSQKKQIQKISIGKKVEDIDEYLIGVGMVTKIGSEYRLFTPLLAEYIKANISVKLPVKEKLLFNLLRKNLGKVVSKDEIFANIWSNSDGATDWALDALIYRLRKHSFLQSQGYIIESQKKVGYSLIQV